VRLLFDENVSRRLVELLSDEFSDSAHVTGVGLGKADDRRIWEYAREQEFVIVSKDSDFADLAILLGAPPKAVWLRVGNATTAEIADVLRANVDRIEAFGASSTESFLVVSSLDLSGAE
jgi:predicted nuclease of predicted toxin-antitoxin system